MNAFEKIISIIPKDLSVLDVGAGGLHGENTSDALLAHFKDYTGICTEKQEVEVYQAMREEKKLSRANIIFGDFLTTDFGRYFDVIVHDLNVEANMESWEDHFEKVLLRMRPDGYLVTYVMTTTEYGDPLITPHLLRKHWATFWKCLPPHNEAIGRKLKEFDYLELILAEREERRPYITWVLLKSK